MATTQATPQACTHPGRDLAIVALSAALVGLFAFTVVTLLNGTPLGALKACSGAFATVAGFGLALLQHLKRNQ